MDELNFICCGQVGDLIHQLFVIKSKCLEKDTKANLYIADSSYGLCVGGDFTFELNKTFEDLKDLIGNQTYINRFEILSRDLACVGKICNCGYRTNCLVPDRSFIYLDEWRLVYRQQRKSWTNLLSDFYLLKNKPNKYIDSYKEIPEIKNKILIHNSNKRHNYNFPWIDILNRADKEVFFITTDLQEYENFRFKNDKIKPFIVSNIGDMVNAIGSCHLFIGNQSAPLAIASALNIPRIAELHSSSYEFYINEQTYSDNISWFLSSHEKYNSKNIDIQI